MSDNEKVTEKTVTIQSIIDFLKLGLPQEDTVTTIEKSESNKLTTCDKLLVKFSRLDAKKVYGNKKEKIEKNQDFINKVESFLKSVYDSSDASGDDEKDPDMSFSDWCFKLAVQRAQVILMQRARTAALKLENTNVDSIVSNVGSALESGKMDLDAIAKLQKMLDDAKAQAQASSKK